MWKFDELISLKNAGASKNTTDNLFKGNLVPVNSQEIKQSLGANHERAKFINFFRFRYRRI